MPDRTISNLPPVTNIEDAGLHLTVQGVVGKQTTHQRIRNEATPNLFARAGTASQAEIGAIGPAGEAGTKYGNPWDSRLYQNAAAGGVTFDLGGTPSFNAVAPGTDNIALGLNNIAGVTTGVNNTAVGHEALRDLTQGNDNVALGYRAGRAITTGSDNVAIGAEALYRTAGANTTTTGSGNVAVGWGSGFTNNTQRDNTVALGSGTNVNGNNAVGVNANPGFAGAVAIGKDTAGGSATPTAADDFALGTVNHTALALGHVSTTAGVSAQLARVGGPAFTDTFADVGSVGTGETTLLDIVVPANTIAVDSDKLLVTWCGTLFNSAANKRIRVYILSPGSSLCLDTTSLSVSATNSWIVRMELMWDSAAGFLRPTTDFVCSPNGTANLGTQFPAAAPVMNPVTTPFTIRITGTSTGGTAANNDVLLKFAHTQWLPAA